MAHCWNCGWILGEGPLSKAPWVEAGAGRSNITGHGPSDRAHVGSCTSPVLGAVDPYGPGTRGAPPGTPYFSAPTAPPPGGGGRPGRLHSGPGPRPP